jgi:glutamine synthetase
MQGVADKEELVWGDCMEDPALLSSSERQRLNVQARLPRSIWEALEALTQDSVLRELLGHELVQRYLDVKTAETEMLEKMGEQERSRWIMERY